MAAWPGTLPVPLQPGYGGGPVDPSRRTDMEFGAARSRRVTKSRDDRINVEWKFTDAQMDIFRTWFDNDAEAAGGSAWFTVSLPIGNTGFTSQEARFIGAYKFAALPGLNWSVTAMLEVR